MADDLVERLRTGHRDICDLPITLAELKAAANELATLRERLRIAEAALEDTRRRLSNAEDATLGIHNKAAFAWIKKNIDDALDAMGKQ